MRKVLFIGRAGCNSCWHLLETVVTPLMERYPGNVSVHYSWDQDIERVNRRKKITRIPLFVVENGGEEDFRFGGRLEADELAAIIECDDEVITLESVLDGDFR